MTYKKRTYLLFLLAVSLVAVRVSAQDTGGLEDVEVEIIKERQLTLPPASRNFEKIPPRPAEQAPPSVTYDFRSFSFQAPEVAPRIRPLRLKQENPSQAYGGYVSLGYGNYASPYAEAFLNNRKDSRKLVGAHLWHRSSAKGPVDDKNSGGGTSGLSLYGKAFGDVISASGKIGWENLTTHFYGYPEGEVVSRDDIRQSFNFLSVGGEISNTRKTKFKYTLGARFSYMADHYDAKETDADLSFKTGYEIDKLNAIELRADYSVVSRKDASIDPGPRSLFSIGGQYVFSPLDGLDIRAGAKVAVENDTLDSKDLHVFPDVQATFSLTPTVDLIGSLSGGVDEVSLHSLVRENRWVAPGIAIYHTNRLFEFLAGIKARLGSKVEVEGGLAAAHLKNLYSFVNDPDDQSKFITVFDPGTVRRNNVYAAISYTQSERAKFMARGDFYTYTAGDLAEVWHRPTYRLSANAFYNVFDKILLKADMIVQGGMKALDQPTQEKVSLDNAFDLNARVEYLFSNSFSFFVQLNNIASNEYPMFYHYPVRGMQVLGGITWSF
ncbi:MAG TPA: hypothetical protein VIL31_08390 [Cyclobacteriaceae bacterium]|jgi:hypothetical protein